jgi:hypothetical protein
VPARGESGRPTLSFVCSPSLAILDNWLPALWKLRDAESQVDLVCVFPRSRSVDEIDLSNVLISLAGAIFDRVLFRSHAGNWLLASTFAEAVALNRLGRVEALAHGAANRLRDGRVASAVSGAVRYGLQGLERGVSDRATAVVRPRIVLQSVRAVLYDVSEERKEYNDELMRHLEAVPRFSICHGIEIRSRPHGPGAPHNAGPWKAGLTAYLFSALEKEHYREEFALLDAMLKVVGIPRHEPEWMRLIIAQSGDAAAQVGEGYILVISKPVNEKHLPRERKRQAFEDIKRLARALGTTIVVKRHPKERADGLCEEVFGRDTYGERWVYSNLHAFVLGARCAFAIAFHSAVVLDMIALGTPVIERLDLRGLPWYDHSDALRDDRGEPILNYRHQGLALGASDYERLRGHADEIVRDRDGVVAGLVARYRELFPTVAEPSATIARDVLSKCLAGEGAAFSWRSS